MYVYVSCSMYTCIYRSRCLAPHRGDRGLPRMLSLGGGRPKNATFFFSSSPRSIYTPTSTLYPTYIWHIYMCGVLEVRIVHQVPNIVHLTTGFVGSTVVNPLPPTFVSIFFPLSFPLSFFPPPRPPLSPVSLPSASPSLYRRKEIRSPLSLSRVI